MEPDHTRPDGTLDRLNWTRPDRTRPDRTGPDQTRPDQTRPDQTRPDQTTITLWTGPNRPEPNYDQTLSIKREKTYSLGTALPTAPPLPPKSSESLLFSPTP